MKHPRLESCRPHLIAALITPFTSTGEVDRPSLTRLVGFLHERGIDEYFAVGSTGESPLLDERDRLVIIETVRAAAPDACVYAGISGMGHRHAIRNAQDAARAGADAVVVMSPFFVALDQEQLVHYCRAIADGSPVPAALYHHLRMPTAFAVTTLTVLAEHPNILALKDTNGADHNRCHEVLAATAGRPFFFFQGVEKLLLPTLEAGGHGGVFAQACIAPQLFRGLLTAWESGQRDRAADFQQRIDALWEIFTRREVRQSFAHFLHTLKLPLRQRGIIATTAGALPHAHFEPEFEQMVTDFVRPHLEPAANAL